MFSNIVQITWIITICVYMVVFFLIMKYSRDGVFKTGSGRRISYKAIRKEIAIANTQNDKEKLYKLKYIYLVFLFFLYSSIIIFILNLLKTRGII